MGDYQLLPLQGRPAEMFHERGAGSSIPFYLGRGKHLRTARPDQKVAVLVNSLSNNISVVCCPVESLAVPPVIDER